MSEGVPSFVLNFAIDLINQKTRTEALRNFCSEFDLEVVLVFIPDTEIDALLVAPGFPQTLPAGERWRAFVSECLAAGMAKGALPWPTADTEKKVRAVSADGYVLAAVGESICNDLLQQLRSVLPLVGAAFKGERAALAQAAHAAVASETAKESHALALSLDKARRDAQREVSLRRKAEEQVRKRNRVLEVLNRTGSILAAELDPGKVIQLVTNAGTEITGAQFGAFIRKQQNEKSQEIVVTAFSGVDRIAIDGLISADNSAFLSTTLRGNGIVCVADITADGSAFIPLDASKSLRMKSYLAAPVSKTGRILGMLVFGHAEASVFTPDAEDVIRSLAAAGAIAIDNAMLYEALQRELQEHKNAEQQLRKAQDALKNTNEQLEVRVKERTASLEEAVSQMEEFSYSVSHDLRAPLRAMSAYAGVLLEEYGNRLDQTGRGYLEKIQRSSDRMMRLTQDVLAYSRVARSQAHPEIIDFDRLVRDVIYQHTNLQSPAAEIQIIGPLPHLLGHETTLGQSVSNLLTNAVKFVAPGVKPQVRIRAEHNTKKVRVWFEDNGIGIGPEHQKRIFSMFERVHPEGKYDGTGIGLTIVRKAIEKMGGTVGVESDGQNGSRFWIELRSAD